MKVRVCWMIATISLVGCVEEEPHERPAPTIEECRGWDANYTVATATISVAINDVPTPAPQRWNVAIKPVFRHDGHDIYIEACAPDHRYFDDIEEPIWWDGWTFVSTWMLDGPVLEGQPVGVAAANTVHRPGMMAAVSKREVIENACTPAHCGIEVKRVWFAGGTRTGEVVVEHYDPVERKFKASGWVRSGGSIGSVADIHMTLDLTW